MSAKATKNSEMDEIAEYYETHDTASEMEGGRVVQPLSDPMIVTSVRLPKSTLDQIRNEAGHRGIGPTQLIRQWIEAALLRDVGDHRETVAVSELLEFLHQQRQTSGP